jgi:hypothetical protein
MKTTKNLSQDSRSPFRDLKPGPPEYKPGVLTTEYDVGLFRFGFNIILFPTLLWAML